jgi:hypothetical protein
VNTIRTFKFLFSLLRKYEALVSNNKLLKISLIGTAVTILATVVFFFIFRNWCLATIVGLIGGTIFIFWAWLLHAIAKIYNNLRALEQQVLEVSRELAEAKALIAIKAKDLTIEHIEAFNKRTR